MQLDSTINDIYLLAAYFLYYMKMDLVAGIEEQKAVAMWTALENCFMRKQLTN